MHVYICSLAPNENVTELFSFGSTQAIEDVRKIKDGYNPSTWMLEVTSATQEQMTGINFSQVYKNSELYR